MNHSPSITGLSEEATEKSCRFLQVILANTIFMQQLYKKYHWHVQGNAFYELHLLFDKHAGEQLPIIDTVAERIRTLGGRAEGLPQDVITNTTLSEHGDPGFDSTNMLENLLEAHEKYQLKVRDALKELEQSGDEGTLDILVSDVLRVHELQTWFIRSQAHS